MNTSRFAPKPMMLIAFVIVVAISRIPNAAYLSPLSNFTPLGAMALFGGAYFKKTWQALAFPLLSLLLTDLVIQHYVFDGRYGLLYSSWYWVYGGFSVIVFIGRGILKQVRFRNFISAALVSTLVYWLLVDFGVFLSGCTDITTGQVMDHRLASLVKCYAQGAPFIKNFFIGTLAYGSIMFGAMEWLNSKQASQLQTRWPGSSTLRITKSLRD